MKDPDDDVRRYVDQSAMRREMLLVSSGEDVASHTRKVSREKAELVLACAASGGQKRSLFARNPV